MRIFLLRIMQSFLLVSICISVWFVAEFFNSFIWKPLSLMQDGRGECGNVYTDQSYADKDGLARSYRSFNGRDGKALFNANCASCHQIDRDLTGPALQCVEDRWPNKKKLYAWIRNTDAILKSGDKYTNALVKKFNGARMSSFPNLSDDEIGAILDYISWRSSHSQVVY